MMEIGIASVKIVVNNVYGLPSSRMEVGGINIWHVLRLKAIWRVHDLM